MTIIFCWSVSAVPREHVSPGEPASRNVCSAGPRRWCWWGLQWKGHIWLHAQRLHCACFQHPPRHRCCYTPFIRYIHEDECRAKYTLTYVFDLRLGDVRCIFFNHFIPKTPKQQRKKTTCSSSSSDNIVRLDAYISEFYFIVINWPTKIV